MEDNRIYNLDIEAIKNDFKFKNEDEINLEKCNVIHSQCNKFKLLPYAANEKTLVSKFDGVIGEFSRIACDKELKDAFDAKEFIENVTEEIEEFEGDNSKQNFKSIIRTMFIDNDKYARFLFSIFMDNELKEEIKKHYNKDTDNILNRLVLRALPELKDKKVRVENYKCYLPFIRELFIKDFTFLMSDEELYKNSISRFLEY